MTELRGSSPYFGQRSTTTARPSRVVRFAIDSGTWPIPPGATASIIETPGQFGRIVPVALTIETPGFHLQSAWGGVEPIYWDYYSYGQPAPETLGTVALKPLVLDVGMSFGVNVRNESAAPLRFQGFVTARTIAAVASPPPLIRRPQARAPGRRALSRR
jgi:hypothetical protein